MTRRLLLVMLLALLGCAPRHAPLSVTKSACLQSHYSVLTGDAEILDRLGYCGPNRGVYVIGETRCYSNDARPKFWDAKDLRCY
jgi:hypothetical protein